MAITNETSTPQQQVKNAIHFLIFNFLTFVLISPFYDDLTSLIVVLVLTYFRFETLTFHAEVIFENKKTFQKKTCFIERAIFLITHGICCYTTTFHKPFVSWNDYLPFSLEYHKSYMLDYTFHFLTHHDFLNVYHCKSHTFISYFLFHLFPYE